MEPPKPPKRKNIVVLLNALQRNGEYGTRSTIAQNLGMLRPKFFGLRDMIDHEALSGHVFIGFSKDGCFVLSYTQILMNNLFELQHQFDLHWWEFVPNKPLKKVHQTRLFNTLKDLVDLSVYFCQWPSDDQVVVIFGLGRDERRDENYLTIAGAPPTFTCRKCVEARQRAEYLEETNAENMKCLFHSFTIHTKYNVSPNCPKYMAAFNMTIGRHIIVNTGDNIVLIKVDIGEDIFYEPTSVILPSFIILSSGYDIECKGFAKTEAVPSTSTAQRLHPVLPKVGSTECNLHTNRVRCPCISMSTAFYTEENVEEYVPEDAAPEYEFDFEVLGCRGALNRVDRNDIPQGQRYIKIQQMVFDLEMCCNEIARDICATAGLTYMFLDDYDSFILSLCPFSQTAAIMVSILLIAEQPGKLSKMYSCQFKLHWDINTGLVSMMCPKQIVEMTDELLSERRNICKGTPYSMHITKQLKLHPLAFPTPRKATHILSNSAVFRERSLRFLVSPTQDGVVISRGYASSN